MKRGLGIILVVGALVLAGGLFAGWLDPIPIPYDSFAPNSNFRRVEAFKSTDGEPLFLFIDKPSDGYSRGGRIILNELSGDVFYALDTIFVPVWHPGELEFCLHGNIWETPSSDSLLLIFENEGIIFYKWVYNNLFCDSDSLEYFSYLTPDDSTFIWPCVCSVVYSFDNEGGLWISYSTMDWLMTTYYLCSYKFDFPYIEPEFCDTQNVGYSPAYYFLNIYPGLTDTLISIYYGGRNFTSDYQIDPCVISYLSSGDCVMTNFWEGDSISHKRCQSLNRIGNSLVMAGRTDSPIVGANYWVSWKKPGFPWSDFISTPVDSPWVCTQSYNGLAMLNEDTCFLAFKKYNIYETIDSELVHLGELPPEFTEIPYEIPFNKGLQALGFYDSKLYIQFWNDSHETFIGIFDPSSPGIAETSTATKTGNCILVYPNPANNYCNISVPKKENTDIECYDIRGHLLFKREEMPGQSSNFVWLFNDRSGNELPNGLYFLKVKNGSEVLSTKIVKIGGNHD